MVVLGVSRDKDVEAMLQAFRPLIGEVVTTQASIPRAMPAAELADVAARCTQTPVFCEENPQQALVLAEKLARKKEPVLVTGSLFLVGDILRK